MQKRRQKMAGPYTHVIACQMASESRQLSRELRQLLNQHHCFLLLGSVSPDLPSIWDALPFGSDNWADKMHDADRLNNVVKEALTELHAVPDTDPRLAWLFGYVGHMVADVVVHPVVGAVQAKRGGKNIHQIIEIHQDALCFKEIKHYELKKEFFLDWLKECDAPKYKNQFAQTLALWERALEKTFGGEPDCRTWYNTYINALHLAVNIPFQFRGYTYPEISHISAQDKKDFYTEVLLPLPNAPKGSFRGIVLERASVNITEVWKALWECKKNGGNVTDIIPNWNLNNGRNRDTGRERDLWQ
jgi:hypothetical protein